MAVEGTAAAPASGVLEALEGAAWRIPLATRRLFLTLAVGVVVAIMASSLAAAWLASRNADTVDTARETGLGVARAAIDVRLNLAAADAEAASTLLTGGLEPPETRQSYTDSLASASQALADAALVATDDDRDAIERLAVDVAAYAGLVENARTNARQGFPVGAAYLDQARELARDRMMPTADQLRRVGEQRVARAANDVGGAVGVVAIVVLVLALGALVASAAVVAGRTRRLTHPALLVAAAAAVAALVLVTTGIVSQGRQLRAAATAEFDAYVTANDAAFTVSNMRVAEIGAVASRGSGRAQYIALREDADALLDTLVRQGGPRELISAVREYSSETVTVRISDLVEGDNQAATENTLGGPSAAAFATADGVAVDAVDEAFASLSDRFEAASDAAVNPLLPIVLGGVAAAFAAAGTLARTRPYR